MIIILEYFFFHFKNDIKKIIIHSITTMYKLTFQQYTDVYNLFQYNLYSITPVTNLLNLLQVYF